jgi:hypothetical protein
MRTPRAIARWISAGRIAAAASVDPSMIATVAARSISSRSPLRIGGLMLARGAKRRTSSSVIEAPTKITGRLALDDSLRSPRPGFRTLSFRFESRPAFDIEEAIKE